MIELQRYKQIVKSIIIESSNIIGIYILWVCAHYLSTHLYVKLCVDWSIIGFVTSPFLVTMPHCIGLLWAINQGSRNLQVMWVILGYWLVKHLNPLMVNENKKTD